MNGHDLKNSIFQLAIQGKLVEQRQEEGAAKELLKQILAERERLVKEGKIKKQKALSEIIEEEIPFDIPESWEWVRLGNICKKIGSGSTPTGGKAVYKESGIKFLRSQNVYNDGLRIADVAFISEEQNKQGSIVKPKDILLNITGGSIGRCALVLDDFDIANINQHVMIIRNIVTENRFFLHNVLISPYVQSMIMSVQVGVSREGLSAEKLKDFLIPLPPLEEQKRIVAKIEELLPYVHQYDEAHAKVKELNKKFPEEMQKSILQYAIQGKLVVQRQDEGTAEDLYQQIQAEKAKLVKEGKIKREKSLPAITEDEIPFDIPESWMWVRLENICEYIQRGKSPKYSDIKKYPVVAQKCNQWSGFSLEKAKFIDPETITSYKEERILVNGDLMWNSTGLGTLGRIAIYEDCKNPYELAVADSHVTVIRPLKTHVSFKYLYYYFSNPSVQNVIEEQSDGSTKQKELSTNTVKNYIVPLPPLEEQKRIVAKIEELLPLTKQLVK